MPPRVYPFSLRGGFQTDRGQSAPSVLDGENLVVPWLVTAENCVYRVDGWPKKMPGASKVNSVTTGATDTIAGIFDYWRQGTGGTPVQKRVIYAGTAIYKDDADGTWDSLKTGLEANKMPSFAVMNDALVMASTSNVDVPQVYDQTSIANLGGSPPNFAFCVEHKDRLFAAGVVANPSRLYYTALGNHQDWTGAGSGSIDVYSDDGDQLTALASFKNELMIFKGPNTGSIYRLVGSSPTGSEAFGLVPFARGVGATNHQALIPVADDLIFWDHRGIHSLKATAAYGDYYDAFLSAGLHDFFQDELNHARFTSVWGANFSDAGYALWTVSQAGMQTNNRILLMDHRFTPPRFALWTPYTAASISMVIDTSTKRVPWFGRYTGFVLRGNRSDQNVDGAAYTYTTRFPYQGFGDPFFDKVALKARVGYVPRTGSFTVGWTRDGFAEQTASLTQAGTGGVLDSFLLDTDTLGGGASNQGFFDPVGAFKEIQFRLSQATINVDFEPNGLAVLVDSKGLGFVPTRG